MISVVRAITTGSYRKNVVEFGFMKVSQNTSYMFLQWTASQKMMVTVQRPMCHRMQGR